MEQLQRSNFATSLLNDDDGNRVLLDLLECTETHIAYLDRDFNFIWVNQAYALGSGHTVENLLNKNHFALFPNEENQRIFTEVRDSGVGVRFENRPFIFAGDPDRGVSYWTWSLSPVKDESFHVKALVLSLVDVTAKCIAQKETERFSGRFRTIFEHANDALLLYDTRGMIIEVNPAAVRMLSLSRNPAKTPIDRFKNVFTFIDPSGAVVQFKDWPYFRALRGELMLNVQCTAQFRKKEWYGSYSAIPVFNSRNEIDWVLITIADITERKKAERGLKELNENLERQVVERTEQIRALAKALTLAEQRERHRFSEILHDDLQQILLSQRMLIDTVEVMHSQNTEVREMLERIRLLTTKAINTARSVALELNPPVLRNEGLDASVKWIALHMEESYGLSIKVKFGEKFTNIQEDVRILLVQIVRELIYNTVKHAKVKELSVTGKRSGSFVVLRVQDRGAGFDDRILKSNGDSESHGIFSIKERLKLIGGTLSIESAPGEGTKAIVSVPI